VGPLRTDDKVFVYTHRGRSAVPILKYPDWKCRTGEDAIALMVYPRIRELNSQ